VPNSTDSGAIVDETVVHGALNECHRVASDGAVLALTTNLEGHMQEFYSVFEEILKQIGDGANLARLREHVAHRATVPGVSALLQSNGFKIRSVIQRQMCMRFASGTALLNHHFIKLGFLHAWKEVVPTRQREVFGMLREALDAQAERDGELRLTIPMAYVEAAAE
jgi:arsenite methyltransferase